MERVKKDPGQIGPVGFFPQKGFGDQAFLAVWSTQLAGWDEGTKHFRQFVIPESQPRIISTDTCRYNSVKRSL